MWSYTYTGQTKREEDPYIRRVDFLGDIGADIRDRTTGSRRVLKKTERAPPATSKKEQQPQKMQLQQIQSQVAGTSFYYPLISFH